MTFIKLRLRHVGWPSSSSLASWPRAARSMSRPSPSRPRHPLLPRVGQAGCPTGNLRRRDDGPPATTGTTRTTAATTTPVTRPRRPRPRRRLQPPRRPIRPLIRLRAGTGTTTGTTTGTPSGPDQYDHDDRQYHRNRDRNDHGDHGYDDRYNRERTPEPTHCAVDFSASTTSGQAPLTVTFTSTTGCDAQKRIELSATVARRPSRRTDRDLHLQRARHLHRPAQRALRHRRGGLLPGHSRRSGSSTSPTPP